MPIYELISGEMMILLNIIFVIMATMSSNKQLKLFFTLLLMWSIPLTIAYGTEIINLNDTGPLSNLIILMNASYSLSIFSAIGVTAYIMIELIMFVLAKLAAYKSSKQIDVTQGLEDL
jgi:hypothetical protein